MTVPPYDSGSDDQQRPGGPDPYGQQPPAQPPAGGEQPAYGQQPPAYGQQPPAYGQPAPAYGQPAPYGHPYPTPKQDEKAVWALVLAIAGWVICPVVAHIVGLVLANQSLTAIRRSNGWLTGEGMARAAQIISIIGLTLALLSIVLLIGLVAVAGTITY